MVAVVKSVLFMRADELRLVRLDRGQDQPGGFALARDRGLLAERAGLRAVRLHRSVDAGGETPLGEYEYNGLNHRIRTQSPDSLVLDAAGHPSRGGVRIDTCSTTGDFGTLMR